MQPLVRSLCLLLVLTSPLAVAEADPPGEAMPFPVETQTSEAVALEWVVVRVVDAWTRRPIAGATVDVVEEAKHPAPDRDPPMAKGSTDADGWARIRLDPPRPRSAWPDWVRAHHPAYASIAYFGMRPDDDTLMLAPRQDAQIQVLDPLGRPVMNAILDHLLGCGHCPTVLNARTDQLGIGHLRGIDCGTFAQTWLVADRLESEYVEHVDWQVGDPPLRHWANWANVWEGRVVDDQGRPLEGVAIGMSEVHRGPWAHTDRDGRFRLVGMDAPPGCQVHFGLADCTRAGWRRDLSGPVTLPLAGVSVLLRLPKPPDDAYNWWEPPEPAQGAPVRVDVVGADGKAAFEVTVMASRMADGLTVDGATNEQGRASLPLLPGEWIVEASPAAANDSESVYTVRTRVRVAADGAAPVQLCLPEPRLLRVALETGTKADVNVVTERLDYDVSEDARTGTAFLVPATGTVHLRIESDDGGPSAPRLVRVDDKHFGTKAPPLPIVKRDLSIRVTAEDPNGNVVPVWVHPLGIRGEWQRHVDRDFGGEPKLVHDLRVDPWATPWIGVYPKQDGLLSPTVIAIPIGAPQGERLDVPPATLASITPRAIRIEALGASPQAKRLADALYEMRVGVLVSSAKVRLEGELRRPASGPAKVFWSDDRRHAIPAGALVTLSPINEDTVLPHRVVAPEAGELVLRWPTGEVTLDVVDEAGETPSEVRVLFNGVPAAVHVLGVAPGAHRILVGAPGFGTQRHEIAVSEDQSVSRKIVLRRTR